MKAVFISFYKAFYMELIEVLDNLEIRGFTFWEEVQGRGSETGEPHYGTHAWPTLNNAIISIVPDEAVDGILKQLKEKDLKAPELGLRAFYWTIDGMI